MALILGVAGSALATAGPVSAAVPGLVQFPTTSVTNSESGRSAVATCPAGKQLVGTGAEITGGGGEVGIEAIRPNGTEFTAPTSVTVLAREIDAFSGTWSVTAYAICANPLPGLSQYVERSPRDSEDPKTTTATCRDNKQLVGTGADITAGGGKVGFDDLRPNGTVTTAPTTFTVTAYELDAFPGEWSVTAYAICANPLPGLSRHAATTDLDSVDPKAISVTCPDGKKMTGLGGEITGAIGEAVFGALRPNGNAITAPTSNTVRVDEEDPLAGNWQVTAYGICANT